MKNLTLAFLVGMVAGYFVVPSVARAEDRYIGTISPTGFDAGANAWHNLTQPDAGFIIPNYSKLSVQPQYDTYICVDSQNGTLTGPCSTTTCSSTNGTLVPAGALFQTSCAQTPCPVKTTQHQVQTDGGWLQADGGYTDATININSCTVAVVAADGGLSSVKVFRRLGNEAN